MGFDDTMSVRCWYPWS